MKKYEDKTHDERQKLEQGKAFQYGFITITCLMLVFFPLYDVFELSIFDTTFRYSVCLYPACLVSIIYAIRKDAYDGITNEIGKISLTMLGIIGALEIAMTLIKMIKERILLISHGVLSESVNEFFFGATFVIICIVYWIHKLRAKKTAETEE